MAVDERDRHQFSNRAVEIFGEREADILMAHLPPGGYPNLATKQDILDLKQWVADRLDATTSGLRAEIVGELKAYVWRTVLIANVALTGLVFAAARLGA